MQGMELMEGENNFQIDLGNLPQGIYLLSLQDTEGQLITERVLIE